MNQPVKKISILITASLDAANRIATMATSALEENQWDGQFLHIDPTTCESVDRPARLQHCSDLDDALKKSSHSTVILLDDRALIDADQWRWAEKQLDHTPVQGIYDPRKPTARWVTKILVWFYSLLSRLLIKHPVNRLTPAALFIDNRHATIDAIIRSISHLPDQGVATWKVVSAIRLDGCLQIRLNPASSSVSAPERHDHRFKRHLPGSDRIHSRDATAATTALGHFWFRDTMFPAIGNARHNSQSLPLHSKLKRIAAACLLLFIAIAMLGSQLSYPLFEPDETRNAQLALNILENNQWMVLELNGNHYWDKPPLMAWGTAASYRAFGVSERSARLPGVLMIVACIILILFAGKRLVGFRAAWIGAMLTVLSCGIPFAGRYLTMDSALTCCATGALLSTYIGSFTGRFRKPWWIAAGIFTGLGLLAKGPIMLVICLPPVILFSWLTNQPLFHKFRRAAYWAVPCLLVAGPWFIGTMIATPEFLVHFLWKHNVVRFASAFNHQQPVWYYLPMILLVMFPASQLFLAGIKFFATRKPEVRTLRSQAHGYLVIIALWLFGFFSLSQAKLPTYIFPAVPFLCLLLGTTLEVNIFQRLEVEKSPNRSWFKQEHSVLEPFYRRLPMWLSLNMAFWIAVVSVAILVALPGASAPAWVMATSACITVVFVLIACHRRTHPAISWSVNCILALFLSSLLAHRVVPAISQARSIQNAVAELKQQPDFVNIPVVYFARDNFASQFLLGNLPVTHFPETETYRAADHLLQHPDSILVSTPDHIEELQKALRWQVRVRKHETARHVYLTSPVAPRPTQPMPPNRVADQDTRKNF